VGDLGEATTREGVRERVVASYPDDKPGRISNFTGQLHALRNHVTVGDFVVLPLRRTSAIAIGRVTGPYEHSPAIIDGMGKETVITSKSARRGCAFHMPPPRQRMPVRMTFGR
jgi:predicted Mrr-cat superfamily restriction endonuclease